MVVIAVRQDGAYGCDALAITAHQTRTCSQAGSQTVRRRAQADGLPRTRRHHSAWSAPQTPKASESHGRCTCLTFGPFSADKAAPSGQVRSNGGATAAGCMRATGPAQAAAPHTAAAARRPPPADPLPRVTASRRPSFLRPSCMPPLPCRPPPRGTALSAGDSGKGGGVGGCWDWEMGPVGTPHSA